MSDVKYVKVNTPKSLMISNLGLALMLAALVIIPYLPIGKRSETWVYLGAGAIGIALTRAARRAMGLRPEIGDERLTNVGRRAKFMLKFLIYAVSFIYGACAIELISYPPASVAAKGAILALGLIALAAGMIIGRNYERRFLAPE